MSRADSPFIAVGMVAAPFAFGRRDQVRATINRLYSSDLHSRGAPSLALPE